MSHKFFKPIKKYVSRNIAIDRMKLTSKQFDRLTVLCGVYPMVAVKKHRVGEEDGWYYRIDDIKRIFYSSAYEICNRNMKKSEKRNELIKVQQYARADKICDEEINFVELVKQKYASFAQSLEDFGHSLRNLYFINMLAIDNVREELNLFEDFLVERGLLNCGFLSKKGVYFSFTFEKIIVCWLMPYPGLNLSDLVEEKLEAPNKLKCTFDFLDFEPLSEDESEEQTLDKNDPDKLDISLLKYSSPLLKIHLKLTLFKLEKLLPDTSVKTNKIFSGKKFCVAINSIKHHIELAIKCCGGDIVDANSAEIIVAEVIDDLVPDIIYVQSQYIFDSLNQSKMLSFENYAVGKICPSHISPFPNILDTIDERALKILSNKKKYDILDRVEDLN